MMRWAVLAASTALARAREAGPAPESAAAVSPADSAGAAVLAFAGVLACALIVAAATLPGRRRTNTGWTVGGVLASTVVVAVALAALPSRQPSGILAAHALAALCLGWSVAGVLGLGRLGNQAAVVNIAGHLAAACGLAASAAALARGLEAGELPAWARADLLIVLAAVLMAAAQRPGPSLHYAAAALLLVLAADWGIVETRLLIVSRPMLPAVLAALALFTMLVEALLAWRSRRINWMESGFSPPSAERVAGPRAVFVAVPAASLAALLALLSPEYAWTPITLLAAALACFIAYHQHGGATVAELAIFMIIATVAGAATGWLPAFSPNLAPFDRDADAAGRLVSAANALIGLALASAYLVWLARFWRQQLFEGQPWTTSGRLIPVAHSAARAAAYAAAVTLGVLSIDSQATFQIVPVRTAIGIAIASLAAVVILRDSRSPDPAPGRFVGSTLIAAAIFLSAATAASLLA